VQGGGQRVVTRADQDCIEIGHAFPPGLDEQIFPNAFKSV
jgi:hypothetical protein